MLFSVLTLISALSISVIAAYFSIIGLATIFPGSIEAVIAMGAALEIGKIVAAVWLHKNWKTAPKMLRVYLFGAIVVLMGITSMGIFGFLSKSHIEHEQHAEKAAALVTQVEAKIDREKQYIIRQKELIQQSEDKNQNRSDKSAENIELEQKKIDQLSTQLEKDIELDDKMLAPIQDRINQLNEELKVVQNKPGGLFSNKKKDIENKITEQASEREELTAKKKAIEDRISKYRNETSTLISDIRKRIQEYQNIGFDKPEDAEAKTEKYNSNILDAQERIDSLELEKFDLDDGSRQLEAEVGPIKYVAELIADFTGMNFDIGKAVRIVIIILIFVFDPLALLLVLAAHISLSKKFPKMMEDESVIFEKIAEIEAEHKALNQQQLDIEERKKDLEQDKKILELNENQVKKYQSEISEHKETLRQLKLETQKELLEKEDTSKISAELEKLLSEKENAQSEINKIKTEKKAILNKADQAISSAKEIKLVLEKRDDQDKEIEKLKSEICLSMEEFSKIKNKTELLSHENSGLKKSNQETENKFVELNKSFIELEQINQSLQNSIIDNNKLIEVIKQNSKTIKIHKIGTQETLTINSTKHNGNHSFSKNQSFSESDIQNMIILSSVIDSESQNTNQLESIFNQQIAQFLNPKLSNREYNLSKPVYKFSS